MRIAKIFKISAFGFMSLVLTTFSLQAVPTLISSSDPSYETMNPTKISKGKNKLESGAFRGEVSFQVFAKDQDVFARAGKPFTLTFSLDNAALTTPVTAKNLKHTMHDFVPYDTPAKISLKKVDPESEDQSDEAVSDTNVTFTVEPSGTRGEASVYSSDRFTYSFVFNAATIDESKPSTVTVTYEGEHTLEPLTVAIGSNTKGVPTYVEGFRRNNGASLSISPVAEPEYNPFAPVAETVTQSPPSFTRKPRSASTNRGKRKVALSKRNSRTVKRPTPRGRTPGSRQQSGRRSPTKPDYAKMREELLKRLRERQRQSAR